MYSIQLPGCWGPSLVMRRFSVVPCSSAALRFCFVQIVKRIFQRHAPHVAEPGLLAKLANFRFMKTERAESCAIVSQRRGHAVKHAYAVKHRTQRIRVLLELVRAVDVVPNINAARPNSATNRLKQMELIHRIK